MEGSFSLSIDYATDAPEHRIRQALMMEGTSEDNSFGATKRLHMIEFNWARTFSLFRAP
jgi:hypothetical protein